jgi:H+/Cl- antiporter ClcA
MNPQPKRDALKAWAKSSFVCIVASPAIFMIWELLESGPPGGGNLTSAQIGLFLAISGVAAVTHLLAFTVFGLPLFLRFHREPSSRLWQWPFGIVVGLIIGTLAVPFVPALAWGRPIGQGLIEGATMGALYGTVTAIACLLNRPNVEQGVTPQSATRLESNSSG